MLDRVNLYIFCSEFCLSKNSSRDSRFQLIQNMTSSGGAANKSLVGFVVDASLSMSSMFLSAENKGLPRDTRQSKLELVKNFINTYMCMRCADSKTIEFSVTTFGQDPTGNENHCHELGIKDGYENVHELFNMCHPGQDIYQLVQELQAGPAEGAADVIPALIVAFDSLVNAHKKHLYNRVMVLVTDGEQEITKSDDDFEDLKAVVGSAAVADPDKTNKRGPVPIHVIMIGKCGSQPGGGEEQEGRKPNVIKLKNAVLLKDTARRTGGTYIEAEDPGEMLWALSYGVGLGLRPQLNKTFLKFGGKKDDSGGMSASVLDVPCHMWAMTQMKTPLYLQKKWDERVRSGRASSSAGGGETVDAEAEAELGVRDIQRDITYIHPDDPQSEITIDSFVEGYQYGDFYVPVDSGSREAMRLECHAGLDVIGFVRASSIPRHHFMDVCWVVQGNDMVAESQVGVAALARAMRAQQKVLLARRVSKENDDPYLVTLIPPTHENGTLLMYRIPCADDSRFYSFSSIPDMSDTKKKAKYARGVDALSDYVNLLTVPQVPDTKMCPSNAGNYRMFSHVVARMLGQGGYSSSSSSSSSAGAITAADQLQVPLTDMVNIRPGALLKLHNAATAVSDAFKLTKPKEKKKVKGEKVYFSTLQMQVEARNLQGESKAAAASQAASSSSSSSSAAAPAAAPAFRDPFTKSATVLMSTSIATPAPAPVAAAAEGGPAAAHAHSSQANDYLTKIIPMPSVLGLHDAGSAGGDGGGRWVDSSSSAGAGAGEKRKPDPSDLLPIYVQPPPPAAAGPDFSDAEMVVETFSLAETEQFPGFSQPQAVAAALSAPSVNQEPAESG